MRGWGYWDAGNLAGRRDTTMVGMLWDSRKSVIAVSGCRILLSNAFACFTMFTVMQDPPGRVRGNIILGCPDSPPHPLPTTPPPPPTILKNERLQQKS